MKVFQALQTDAEDTDSHSPLEWKIIYLTNELAADAPYHSEQSLREAVRKVMLDPTVMKGRETLKLAALKILERDGQPVLV